MNQTLNTPLSDLMVTTRGNAFANKVPLFAMLHNRSSQKFVLAVSYTRTPKLTSSLVHFR